MCTINFCIFQFFANARKSENEKLQNYPKNNRDRSIRCT